MPGSTHSSCNSYLDVNPSTLLLMERTLVETAPGQQAKAWGNLLVLTTPPSSAA